MGFKAFCFFIISCSIGFSFAESPEVPIGADEVFVTTTNADEIKIMAWNIENLFDAEKDLFSDDWQWLPKDYPGKQKYCSNLSEARDRKTCSEFDWTAEKIDLKLNQIKKVVEYQGSFPDMMTLEEVENENVVKMLANKLGYKNQIVTESADKRGIDVALMFNTSSQLKFLGHKSIYVALPSNRPGRDILRVDFLWNEKPISVYVNHWPAQRNPNEERIACAKIIRRDIDEMIAKDSSWSGFAVGDFNTTTLESPNPFDSILYDKSWKNALVDGEKLGRNSEMNSSMSFTPPGSLYYPKDDTWQDFDRLAMTQNLIDGKAIDFVPESLRYPFPMFMSKWMNWRSNDNNPSATRKVRVPLRYNFETKDANQRGYADHLPLIFKLVLK
jgi:hypothetical protein